MQATVNHELLAMSSHVKTVSIYISCSFGLDHGRFRLTIVRIVDNDAQESLYHTTLCILTSSDIYNQAEKNLKSAAILLTCCLTSINLQEDQRTLAKLVSKVRNQSDVTDKAAAAAVKAAEEQSLHNIIGKYQVSKQDVDALLKWKHTVY